MLRWQATSAFCGAILAVKAQTRLLPSRGGVDASPMRHSHSSTHSSALGCLARWDPASLLTRQLSLGHFDRFSVLSFATSTTSAAPGHTLRTSALCFPGDSDLAPIPSGVGLCIVPPPGRAFLRVCPLEPRYFSPGVIYHVNRVMKEKGVDQRMVQDPPKHPESARPGQPQSPPETPELNLRTWVASGSPWVPGSAGKPQGSCTGMDP